MWQSDGWAQTRIGVLTPELDVCPEAEFRTLAGTAISIHAARVRQKTYDPRESSQRTIASDRVRAFADPPLVDEAAASLAAAPLHAIAYCFTSSSYLRGAADDVSLGWRRVRAAFPLSLQHRQQLPRSRLLGPIGSHSFIHHGFRRNSIRKARSTSLARALTWCGAGRLDCHRINRPSSRANSLIGFASIYLIRSMRSSSVATAFVRSA